jgi:hypothetical protein
VYLSKAAFAAKLPGVGLLPVTVEFEKAGSDLILKWSEGILQAARDPAGTYTDIPGATSPHTNSMTDDRKFFRVRLP